MHHPFTKKSIKIKKITKFNAAQKRDSQQIIVRIGIKFSILGRLSIKINFFKDK
jgi:hypothetical protein